MSIAAILPALNASNSTPTPSTDTSSAQGLNTMFMQLLMAQLKNQSPLSPVDPTQFVGQLAQFSELSAVTSIYTLLQQLTTGGPGSVPATASSLPRSGSNSTETAALTSKIQGGF
jgi:flagellar basal-body rod modification protein FlgD